MGDRENILAGLKSFKRELNKQIRVDRLIFFGSRASGSARKDGDIDLLIVSDDFEGQNFRRRPWAFYDHWHLDYPVDFICYTKEEFEEYRKRVTIVREAVRTGIEIE